MKKTKVKTTKTKKVKYKLKTFEIVAPPVTDDFWYDISAGGYLKAEEFSDDPATIKAIKDAVKLLEQLENMCDFI